MKKAVFLDRDGVINRTIFRNGKARAPYTMTEFALFDGVQQSIVELHNSGFLCIIVTNQPDVTRGWVSLESVEMINHKVRELLQIDDIKICLHTEKENCICRKPKPGMLIEASHDWGIDLSASFMVGDRFSDVAAGVTAGCKTILVGPGDEQGNFPSPDHRASSLLEAVPWI